MDMNEESRSTKNMHTGSDRWSYHQQISSLQRLQKSHVEPSKKKRNKSPVLCFRQPSKYTNTSINWTTNRRNLNHKHNQQKEQRQKTIMTTENKTKIVMAVVIWSVSDIQLHSMGDPNWHQTTLCKETKLQTAWIAINQNDYSTPETRKNRPNDQVTAVCSH